MMYLTFSADFLVGILILLAPASLSSPAKVPQYELETSLKKRLLNASDKHVRPATNKSTPISIDFKFTLVKINGLDESRHLLETTYFLYMAWTDPRLSWDTSETPIDQIHIPHEDIWHPDVALFNIGDQNFGHTYGDIVIVRHDGYVMWLPGLTTTSWCYLNLYRFPFDSQECSLIFGSWVFSANQIRFNVTSTKQMQTEDIPDYVGADKELEWKVMKLTQKETVVNYSAEFPEWAEIKVTIKLRRLGKYFQSVFVAPIVLLALLTPLVFLLPPDATEKSTLGSVLLLAECILLLNMAPLFQPAHYHIPRLVMFYISTFILTSMSVFASTLVCNIAKKGSRRRGVPAWLSTIFLGRCGLRKVLCVETYSPVQRFEALVSLRENANTISDLDDFGTEMTGPTQNPVERELREIRKNVNALSGQLNNNENYDALTREWYEISRVLDRLLLVVFYSLLTLTAVAFLL